jgi:hypothetical protein
MMRLQSKVESILNGAVSAITRWQAIFIGIVGSAAYSLSLSHPRTYLTTATLLALIGFAWLVMFPFLGLVGLVNLHEAVFAGSQAEWFSALIWFVIASASVLVCYRLLFFRAVGPTGQPLDEKNASGLLQLVREMTKNFDGPVIDQILSSGQFELKIEKTPLIPLPILFRNTLVVGLPFIDYMSHERFQCALAGRLGQYSRRDNRLVNWLNQMRTVWFLYCDGKSYRGAGYQPVSWFFAMYAPIYNAFTVQAARFDELAADTYAIELFNDESVLDMVTTCMVCRVYLDLKYWPVVRKYSKKNSQVLVKLQSNMSNVLRAGLKPDVIGYWMEKALASESGLHDPVPSLAQRVDNIGYTGASMDADTVGSAGKVLILENAA